MEKYIESRNMQVRMAHTTDCKFKQFVSSKILDNFSVVSSDVIDARTLFGPNLPGLRGINPHIMLWTSQMQMKIMMKTLALRWYIKWKMYLRMRMISLRMRNNRQRENSSADAQACYTRIFGYFTRLLSTAPFCYFYCGRYV